MISALDLYASGLAEPAASALRIRTRGGAAVHLPLERWLAQTTTVDEAVLARAHGPVIDVGCGPGRHLHALARRGVFALGIDISPEAVALARTRGAAAIQASVFDVLPGAGCWNTALLLDGNIGIGGEPAALLTRIREQLCDDGEILVELDGPSFCHEVVDIRIESERERSPWFRWARVGIGHADGVAAQAGLQLAERWSQDGRWFVRLSAASPPTHPEPDARRAQALPR